MQLIYLNQAAQQEVNAHTTGCDSICYLAISYLERLGNLAPSQRQIDLMEEIIKLSMKVNSNISFLPQS